MDPLDLMEIGGTGLRVTQLGMGGAPFGGNAGEVTEDAALEAVELARRLGIGYFDTAPLYGIGKSEAFFGRALSGVDRSSFVLSTKIGRVLHSIDEPMKDSGWGEAVSLRLEVRLQQRRCAPLAGAEPGTPGHGPRGHPADPRP